MFRRGNLLQYLLILKIVFQIMQICAFCVFSLSCKPVVVHLVIRGIPGVWSRKKICRKLTRGDLTSVITPAKCGRSAQVFRCWLFQNYPTEFNNFCFIAIVGIRWICFAPIGLVLCRFFMFIYTFLMRYAQITLNWVYDKTCTNTTQTQTNSQAPLYTHAHTLTQ